MRVGSIGSFGAYSAPKNNVKQQNNPPSFKADVRIMPTQFWSPEEMPPEHALQIIEILKHAKTAYKNLGSDNLLIQIQPVMDTSEGKSKKNIGCGIDMFYGFKDAETARKEILENRKKDDYQQHADYLKGLKDRDPQIMEDLKTVEKVSTDSFRLKRRNIFYKSLMDNFDDDMKSIIKYSKYHVPGKSEDIKFTDEYDPYTYEPDPWWIKAMG